MSTPSYAYEKPADAKEAPVYATEFDSDGSSSINTLTALIAEGEREFFDSICKVANCSSLTNNFLFILQITNMRSSFEPCHGRRLHGCSPETKSVLLLWLRHGRSRKFTLVTRRIIATLKARSLQRLGMGSRNYYHGCRWYPLLDHLHDYA